MSKTNPKRCCKYRCDQVALKMCVLGWGFDLSCFCPTVVPATKSTGTLPTSRRLGESKVPLLLPGTCFESKSLGVSTGPMAVMSEDVSGSFSSARVLKSLPHVWVTSREASGYFYRNMASEHSPGKQCFGVTLSVHSKNCHQNCFWCS